MATGIFIVVVLATVIGFGMYLCFVNGYNQGVEDLQKEIDIQLERRLKELDEENNKPTTIKM